MVLVVALQTEALVGPYFIMNHKRANLDLPKFYRLIILLYFTSFTYPLVRYVARITFK